MKKHLAWTGLLIPAKDRSLGKRFIGVSLTWGVPVVVWEVITSGILHRASLLPFFLAVEIPATLVGVAVFTLIEHMAFRSFPRNARKDEGHAEDRTRL